MASLHQRPRTRGRPSPNYFTCTHRRVPRTYTKASLIPGHFNRPIEQPSQPAPPITSDNGRVAACDPIPTRETPRRRLHTTGTESLVAGLGCRGQHRREPPPPRGVPKGNGAAPEGGRVHPPAPVEPVDPSSSTYREASQRRNPRGADFSLRDSRQGEGHLRLSSD